MQQSAAIWMGPYLIIDQHMKGQYVAALVDSARRRGSRK